MITLRPELVEKKEPPSITSIRKTKTRFLGICSNEIPIFETLLEIETIIYPDEIMSFHFQKYCLWAIH